jgi:predicted porin
LSKRTDAYMNVAYAKNSRSSILGVAGINGTSSNLSTLQSNQNQVFDGNQLGAVVGIRHKF